MTPNDATDLSGLVAVVTGAAAGLGRAEAIGLARAGATIVVNDIAGALDKSDVIDEITAAGSKAVVVAGDVSERSTADELVATADGLGGLEHRRQQRRHYPRPHVVQHVRRGLGRRDRDPPPRPLPLDAQRGDLLAGEGQGSRERPKRVYGRIINTSSEAGLAGPVGQANYGAAKAGITALTLTAARALERYGVRANAIAPGPGRR